jgi:hypothetical protein
MSLESTWREKSDEEVAAAATGLSDYTEEACRVIRAELKRRGIPAETSTPLAASDQDLPISWLRFWIWFRLPIGALVTPLVIVRQTLTPRPVMENPIESHIALSLGVAVAVFLVAVAVGLHKRCLWAWRANFGLIFADVLLWPLERAGRSASVSQGATLYVALLGVASLVWALPNVIYFRKRRSIFANSQPKVHTGR